MTILDELRQMKRALDAMQPKPWVDVVLSTKLVSGCDGLLAKYEGQSYLIMNAVVVRRMELDVLVRKVSAAPLSLALPMCMPLGIPVVEDDALVVKILAALPMAVPIM